MTQANNTAKGSSNIDSNGVLLPAGGGTGLSTGTPLASTTAPATNPATGTPSSTTYLRGDGTWSTPTSNPGTVTSVSGTAPVSVATGTSTPVISMAAATISVNGYLTSTDWNTFNGKQPAGSYVTSGGALGTPSSGTLTNCTFPTLNQNTTGSSGSCTGNAATATTAGKVTNALTAGTGISFSSGTTYDGSSAITINSAVTNPIPTGTVMLFYQSAAPSGWTQVTTLNDYDLRLVSGAGGTTGGTSAYSTVFANQTPSINVSGLSAGATTLSTAQVPAHTHSYTATNSNNISVPNTGCAYGTFPGNAGTSGATTGSAFSGGSHNHAISGSATSSAITLDVRYANIIICSKN